METETGTTQLCQGTARTDNHQKLEEAREDSPLEPLEDRSPADTLISDF